MPVRIFLVEDHPLMRRITSEYVGKLPDAEICGDASSAEEALLCLPASAADLVLVDVSLPNMSGIDLVAEIVARWPSLRCLMLSAHTEVAYVERALTVGAKGYVTKGDPVALAEAVRCVSCGGTYVSEGVRIRLEEGKAPLVRLPPQY